jgi:hypothetical protein
MSGSFGPVSFTDTRQCRGQADWRILDFVTRRRAYQLLLVVLMVAIWYFSTALARSEHSLWVVELPVLIGAVLALPVAYRIKRGYWFWDEKRRKIARWRGLIETPVDKHGP